jgi:hypothetical protein
MLLKPVLAATLREAAEAAITERDGVAPIDADS